MKRSFLIGLAVLGFTTAAWAQTASAPTAAPENTGGTPGSWVQAAITRHKALIALRVNGPRGGEAAGDRSNLVGSAGLGTDGTTTTAGGSAGTGATTLDSLLSLIGGSSSSLSSLAGLLGTSLTSTGSPTTGGGTATDPRLAALLALRDANKSSSTEKAGTATQQSSATAGSSGGTARVGGAAVNRLPKVEQRLQSSTTDATAETPFAARWANAMLSTFFTAVTAGFQSTGFINFLKDSLRPLMYPTESSSGGSASGGNNNSGGSGSGGSGSGIEDIAPGGSDSGSGGSAL